MLMARNALNQACNDCLLRIADARDVLKSAARWGVADLFSSSYLVSFFKRDRVEEANEHLNALSQSLGRLQALLDQAGPRLDLEINTWTLSWFLDTAMDNNWATFFNQRKIKRAIRQLDALEEEVRAIQASLV